MRDDVQFWNRIAPKYAKSPVADQTSYEYKLQKTRDLLKPGMEVLEIGCGTGTTALIHAPYVRHIRATDISENMIAIARQKAKDQGIENVSFDVSAIGDLQVTDDSLDMVQAHSILHLLDNRKDVIKQVYQMLKPGGLFVTSTVCLQDGYRFLKPVLPILRLIGFAPKTIKFLTSTQLEQDFTDAGFVTEFRWQKAAKQPLFAILRKPAPAA